MAAFAAIGVAASAGITKAISAAADLNETLSKTGVVFDTQTASIVGLADQLAKSFGLNKQVILDAASSVGLIGKAAGLAGKPLADFSEGLTRIAADASSFFNVPLEEALLAIRSGLVGETEPLRRFGVLLNETAVQGEAVALGLAKVGDELTEQQKVVARSSLIIKGLKDASGDLTRTQDSLANQIRKVRGQFSNMAAELGRTLIPVASQLLTGFSRFAERLLPTFQPIAAQLGGLFASVLPALAPLVEKLLPAFGSIIAALIPALEELLPALIPLVSTFADILIALTPVIPVFAEIAVRLTPLLQLFADMALVLAENFGPETLVMIAGFKALNGVINTSTALINTFATVVLPALTGKAAAAGAAVGGGGAAATGAGAAAGSLAGGILAAVGAGAILGVTLNRLIERHFPEFNDVLEDFGAWIVDHVIPALENFGGALFDIGAKLFEIKEKIHAAIISPVTNAIQFVKDLIKEIRNLIDWLSKLSIPNPFKGRSPSPFEKSLKGIAKAMAEVTAGVQAFARIPALAIPSMGSATSGPSVTQNITVNEVAGDPRATAFEVATEIGKRSIR